MVCSRTRFYYFLWAFSGILCLSALPEPQSLPLPSTISEKESLFLRRIVEFWEEGETSLVTTEIERYLDENSETPFWNYLHGIVGNLLLSQKNYAKALEHYKSVADPSVRDKIQGNFLQCLYVLKSYDVLENECSMALSRNLFNKPEDRKKVEFLLSEAFYGKAIAASAEEEKRKWCAQARPYLEMLIGSPYATEAMERLAALSTLLKEYSTATDWYFTLITKVPEKKEEYLFRVALLQAEYNKKEAIETLGRVCALEKDHLKEAAYNRMILLFEEKMYDKVVQEKARLFSLFPEDKISFAYFFTGKSYFELGDYTHAKDDLERYLSLYEKGSEMKPSLFMLIHCAEKLDDLALYERAFQRFEEHFSQEADLAQVIYRGGLLFERLKKWPEAEAAFTRLERDFPAFNEQGNVLFVHGHLLFELGKWEEAHKKFQEFISAFSSHPDKSLAFRYLIRSSLTLAQKQPEPWQGTLKDELVSFFQTKPQLTEREQKEYRVLLAHVYLAFLDYDSALQQLEEGMHEVPSLGESREALLVSTYCYQGKKDWEKVCETGERALADQSAPDAQLHLTLFNGYLERKKSGTEDSSLLDKASDHLFLAYQMKGGEISKENLQWLAHYYYEKTRGDVSALALIPERSKKNALYIERALCLLRELIFTEQGSLVSLAGGSLSLEPHVVAYAELLGSQGNYEKQIQLLEDLREQYQLSPEISWACRGRSLCILGQAFEAIGDKTRALCAFEEALSIQGPEDYWHSSASLGRIRIHLAQMDQKEKTLSNELFLQHLSELKNLTLQKDLDTEPVHLEAALDYADLRSSLESDGYEKKLVLLLHLKDSFAMGEDFISKEYQEKRFLFPVKDRLVRAYETLVEGEILLCRSQVEKNSNPKEAERNLKQAQEIFLALSQNKECLTAYLEHRVNSNLKKSSQLITSSESEEPKDATESVSPTSEVGATSTEESKPDSGSMGTTPSEESKDATESVSPTSEVGATSTEESKPDSGSMGTTPSEESKDATESVSPTSEVGATSTEESKADSGSMGTTPSEEPKDATESVSPTSEVGATSTEESKADSGSMGTTPSEEPKDATESVSPTSEVGAASTEESKADSGSMGTTPSDIPTPP